MFINPTLILNMKEVLTWQSLAMYYTDNLNSISITVLCCDSYYTFETHYLSIK